MGRRRNRGLDIEGIVGGILALILLLVFGASGFNLHKFAQNLHGLLFFLVLILIVAAIGIVAFLIIRAMIRAKSDGSKSSTRPVTGTSWRFPELLQKATPSPDMDEPSRSTTATVIEKLRATDWYQFEKVVGLIYESQGYQLTRRGGANPDGGIDLIVEKDGDRAAVQCKRWKKWRVDVPKVRELFGAMTHEGLSRGVIVALNGFTLEAKQLAVEHNIDIIHDENLSVMIEGLTTEDQRKIHLMLDDETKYCPKCESAMERKTPPPGKSWKPFWGCPRYPRCRGTLQDD